LRSSDEVPNQVAGDLVERADGLVSKGPLLVRLDEKALVAQDADQRRDGGIGQLSPVLGELVPNTGGCGLADSPGDVHHLQLALR
jgi:hypothetical protein